MLPPLRADSNRSSVLAHLGAHGPTSRADLARALRISPALVTTLTRELMAKGLVEELDLQASGGGRPGRALGLTMPEAHVIGVKVVADHIAIAEVAVDGSILRSATERFDATSPMAVPDLLAHLERFVASVDAPLLGIGIGVPGSVESQADGVVESTQLGWHQVALGAAVQNALGLPVMVENDVNALTMAERLVGRGRDHADFLVVTIGMGVGGGVVSNGTLQRGRLGGAGDLGHVPTVENGPLCQCGNRGCLEAVIGEPALLESARRRGVIEPRDGIDRLLQAADAGDPRAVDVFTGAGRLLGRALAGAVNLLDPAIVLVLGEGVAGWQHWAVGFEPAFRSGVVARSRAISVVVESWQDDAWALGAAALVLATPFDAAGIAGEQGRLVRRRMLETVPQAVRA